MWGVDGIDDPTKWAPLFARVKSEGFQGVEMPPFFFMMPGMKDALAEAGLFLIGQVHTSSDLSNGLASFRYNTSYKVADHIESLRFMVQEAIKAGAIFVNSHSGCDSWSIAEAREYLREALKVEKELGLTIVHETHRRRLFWNPFNFRDILKDDESLAEVKINLDISHWVVCLERCFATKESESENGPVDGWWTEVSEMLQKRCQFIHARVGYAEGP